MKRAHNRELYIKSTRHCYTRLEPLLDQQHIRLCSYCGEYADTIDHVIPVSYMYSMLQFTNMEKSYIVDCCKSCNKLAGSKVFRAFQDKQEYIKNRLIEKNQSLIDSKEWTDEEIEELSGNLKRMVRGRESQRRIIHQRLNFESPHQEIIDKNVDFENWE